MNLFFFFQNNRNNDYYDISPRPFGVPATGSSSSVRAKSFKPSNGFVPQRANIPHQQTQFAQQFTETVVSYSVVFASPLPSTFTYAPNLIAYFTPNLVAI